MILIIGGAYQGKLDYAKESFDITDSDVYICNSDVIDFSKRCIYKIEEFAAHCPDTVDYFKENRDAWQNSILIVQDIFCGVVPIDAEKRVWRQRTGRLVQYLSKEAQRVIRIFCGLEQQLK